MVNKPQRTQEQQEYRNKLAQTLKNLRELWNKDLAEILLERHKNTAEYIDADNRVSWQSENKEKISNFSIERQIENYLMSKEFENYFFKLDSDGREHAIGAVIMYSITFQDETWPIDYNDCLELIKCFVKNGYIEAKDKLLQLISKKLWIKEWDSNYEKLMKEYIYDNIYKNWYVFHGFNSVFEKSIKKNGLSASIRLTPEKEIRELWLLMKKYHEQFDIYYVNWKDSERVCFDYVTHNVRAYANLSPERFWLLVHKFKLYYYGYNNLPDANIPFEYENIVKGMEKFFKERNVIDKDRIRIKELFDKNRKLYWKWKPTLAMIKLQSVDNVNVYEIFDYKTLLSLAFKKYDKSIDRDIPIEDIKIVHFPKNLTS